MCGLTSMPRTCAKDLATKYLIPDPYLEGLGIESGWPSWPWLYPKSPPRGSRMGPQEPTGSRCLKLYDGTWCIEFRLTRMAYKYCPWKGRLANGVGETHFGVRILCGNFDSPISWTTTAIEYSSWRPDRGEYEPPIKEPAENSVHHLEARDFVLVQ